MNKKPITLEEKIIHLEHLLEVVLKNQEKIKAHLWTDKRELDSNEEIHFQEKEAEEYFLKTIKPKLEARKAGEMEVSGFWDGAVLNFLKQQALNFIGTILKKIVLEKAVDFAKWLAEQAEEQIINSYNQATNEEKKLFKNKVAEVFPDSELLKKLG